MSTRNDGALRGFAKTKPVSITQDGELLTLEETTRIASFGGSLYTLETGLKQKLVAKRIELDPKYDLGVIGVGHVTKEEATAHVEADTDLGRMIVHAELTYLEEFLAAYGKEMPKLQEPKPVAWRRPEIPPWKKTTRRVKLPITNTAIFLENTTDSVTKYAAQYRIAHVHPVFTKAGYNVVSLEDINAIRRRWLPEATRPLRVYVSGIGHGSPTTYTGHQGDEILEVGQYGHNEVKEKVFHFLSCQTAKQLGPDVVSNGAVAYTGYDENFTFVWDDPQTRANEMDLFWKCDSTFDLAVAYGLTQDQAYTVTKAVYDYTIARHPNTSAATWLTWDRNHLRSPAVDAAFGDKTAKVSPLTWVWIKLPMVLTEEIPEMQMV